MSVNPERGAFIAYDPDRSSAEKEGLVIPFRFNPESLTRSLSIQQGQASPRTDVRGSSAEGSPGDQGSDASSGSLKETFSVVVRFDLAHRLGKAQELPPELGVAPEVAALESLLHPVAQASEAASDGTEAQRPRPRRPTVLFVWGKRRRLPVRITGMTVLESMANTSLDPTRAEVEVALEVLGEAEAAGDKTVAGALSFSSAKRRELAQRFFDTTASQGTRNQSS